MPQLEKYAFFTQLFWFFSIFFVFFVLLLQRILPALARNLKFRTKLLKHYRKSMSSFEKKTLLTEHLKNFIQFLDSSKNFSNRINFLIKMMVVDNMSHYFYSNYFAKTYVYLMKTGKINFKKK